MEVNKKTIEKSLEYSKNTSYTACTFYDIQDTIEECYFKDCSFRGDTLIVTMGNCIFENCNFNGRLEYHYGDKSIIPEGIKKDITHFIVSNLTMVGDILIPHIPQSIYPALLINNIVDLDNIEFIDFWRMGEMDIPEEIFHLKKLKKILINSNNNFNYQGEHSFTIDGGLYSRIIYTSKSEGGGGIYINLSELKKVQ